jgi:heme-degrading monooxygenase HmoA
VRQSGLVEYRNTPGNAGAYILLRVEDQIARVYTLSFWDSLDSIRAFAGDPIDTARYFPEDDRYLLERKPTVQHFSVVMP